MLLVLNMLTGMVPVQALADEGDTTTNVVITIEPSSEKSAPAEKTETVEVASYNESGSESDSEPVETEKKDVEIKDGVKEDLTQPFAEAGRKTSNFFRRLLGKEEKAAPEQTRHQKILHAQAEKDTQKRLQLQQQQKEEKQAKKIAKKEQKIAEKTAKKAEKLAGKKVKVKALPAETELAAADELKTE